MLGAKQCTPLGPRGIFFTLVLDEDHVRAKITWFEQDVGGGKLVVEVTVKNMKTRPKTDDQLKSDARALAVRFARAFADTIEN
jgi:hypothetical protein